MNLKVTLLILLAPALLHAQKVTRSMKITQRYLNIPVQESQERQEMTLSAPGQDERKFVISLSVGEPDYWVFSDMAVFRGKTLTIAYPEKISGMDKMYQSDEIAGADSLYHEKNRPQFHFTSRRGWNNDPNGLVYYDGEYHLFYQHNPYSVLWGNMHWGHAVSNDLLHWQELGEALYPDQQGVMYSGSAVVDSSNSSGFQSGEEDVLVAAYTVTTLPTDSTAEKQAQAIAYSNDRGRTWEKYDQNPVIDSQEKWNSVHTRDPKIFWHEDTQNWVMVLFEKDGHSFYTSDNLKDWAFQSHLGGFWECPELFELPVDGDENNKKWVIYGASGNYMIGDFDGKQFTMESGKHQYVTDDLYAAQTYNNIPQSDGRRIQIGWGRIPQPGMPFGQMMLFPTELTLRSTRNGIKMVSSPIAEIEQLHQKNYQWSDLSAEEANEQLKTVTGDLFHVKMRVEIVDVVGFAFQFHGNPIAEYNMNHNELNGTFYETEEVEEGIINLELLVDRTSVEVYADGGIFNAIAPLAAPKNTEGFRFETGDSIIKIHSLEIHELGSVW